MRIFTGIYVCNIDVNQGAGDEPATDDCPLAGFCQDFDAIAVIRDTVYAFKGTAFSHFHLRLCSPILGVPC